MSTTVFGVGKNTATYQKTEVFSVAGNHTWTHPLPGQNIEVFVTMVGGAGGSTTGAAAGDGGATIWDTGGTPVSASGGTGAANGTTPGTGFIDGYEHDAGAVGGHSVTPLLDGLYGNVGHNRTENGAVGYGGSGTPIQANYVVSNDVNLTVGAAGAVGAGDISDSQDGAVVISYNVTTTETPVVANLQRRDWDHFGEITNRVAANTAASSITANTITTLDLNTEVLDTGGKVSLSANVMTMEAGTYEFDFLSQVIAAEVGSVIFRLYNITDGSLVTSFSLAQLGSGGAASTSQTKFNGIFSLASQKDLRWEVIFTATAGSRSVGLAQASTLTDLIDLTKFSFKWRA